MDIDWQVCSRARLSRDARFDGRFFIGVRTGICQITLTFLNHQLFTPKKRVQIYENIHPFSSHSGDLQLARKLATGFGSRPQFDLIKDER